MRKKYVINVATIIGSGLVFAACLGTPSNSTPVSLNSQSTRTSQTTPAVSPTAPQRTTMKTLEDFQKIEASQVTLKTNKGDITFEIYTDKVPLTAQNFLNLARSGYYNGIKFHRVIPDFMAQTGDPLSKEEGSEAMWGTGGPGYEIADEFVADLQHDGPGIVSMANRGPNTGGSQFFITYEATPWLDGKHAIFGKVLSGMEILEQITNGDVIEEVIIE